MRANSTQKIDLITEKLLDAFHQNIVVNAPKNVEIDLDERIVRDIKTILKSVL